MSFATLMQELAGLCRLVVVPNINTAADEVIVINKISPTKSGRSNF
ncbi:MAG: hypothetical protein OXD43_08370 [Bacteroidetes bacterium]|nr:hypothetical protein [Bacteroidota bacterium]